MPSFACPKCKKVLKTAAPLPAGKKVKCPACSQIFPVPAEASAEQTAVKAGKPVAPGRSPAAGAPPAPTAQRTRPDSQAAQRTSVTSRKAKARAPVDEEDEEEEERPARRRKKKGGSQNRLMLILSGVGVLVLLVVVAAFIWPGFMLGGGKKGPVERTMPVRAEVAKETPPTDLFKYHVKDAEILLGINFGNIRKNADHMQQIEKSFSQFGLSPPQLELIKAADQAIVSIANVGPQAKVLVAFNSVTHLDNKKVAQAFGFDAIRVGPRYVSEFPGGHVSMQDRNTVVFGKLSPVEFIVAISGKEPLVPEVKSRIDALQEKSLWIFADLETITQKHKAELEELKKLEGGAKASPALAKTKFASFALDWTKGVNLQLDIHCANEQDSAEVESFAKSTWEKIYKPKLSAMAMGMAKQRGFEPLSLLAFETSKNFHIDRAGSKVSATLALGEGAIKGLEKLGPTMGANPQPTNPQANNLKNRRQPLPNKKS